MQSSTSRTYKILFWNENTISNKIKEFHHQLEEEDIDIALISETNLKPGKRFNVQKWGHGCFSEENMKIIPHEPAPTSLLQNLEHTGILFNTKEGNINIYAVYLPPGTDLPEQDFDQLLVSNTPTILVGDINGKHVN